MSRATYSEDQIKEFEAALKNAEKPKKENRAGEVVKKLAPLIEQKIKEGFSKSEILEILKQSGFVVSSNTLNANLAVPSKKPVKKSSSKSIAQSVTQNNHDLKDQSSSFDIEKDV
jgi:ribosomal protein S8